MNYKKVLFLVVFVAVLIAAIEGQTSPEYKILFEKAKFTMETKGDLNGAINLFNDIIKKYPKEREYAAKSQLYIGHCYEKMGAAEARKAYERVVRDYVDQSVIVGQAKERLAVLGSSDGTGKNYLQKGKGEADNQLTFKKLDYSQLNTPIARLSPDGMKIAYGVYAGGSPKSIDILDLNSGTAKVLVESGSGDQYSFVWSPQSDKIAYTVHGKELHIRDINGANSQLYYKNAEYTIYPTDWSRDGKKIVCFFEGDDQRVRIGTVTSDGQAKLLITGNYSGFKSEPKISPDGGYIACSLEDENRNTDIYVWTSDGSRKEQVTAYPGHDENPVWSSDGKYLSFLSDRNRSVDLWCVRIKDGKTVGVPFIIKQDLGWRTRINDLTACGKLFLLMLGGAEPGNLFTIPLDQKTGSISRIIAPISVYPTDHSFPRYSPDGKKIAYLSRRGQMGWPKLFVLDEKGTEIELPLQGYYATNIAWHPENKSLFFTGWDKAYNTGVFEISLEKDMVKTVYSGETLDMKTYKGALVNINLLPETGKMMFFKLLGNGDVDVLMCNPDGQQLSSVLSHIKMPVWGLPSPTGENIDYRIGDSLMVISVTNGTTKHIGSSTGNLESAWAQKGQSLIFREGPRLKIYSLKENASRTIYQAQAGRTIGGMEIYAPSWSPDGSCFIFTERDTSVVSPAPQKLFLINPDNGTLKTLGEAPAGYRLSELRWSPNGTGLVATGHSINSERSPRYNYWVMENFMPK